MSPRTGWAKHGALGGVPEEPMDRAGLATTGSLGGGTVCGEASP